MAAKVHSLIQEGLQAFDQDKCPLALKCFSLARKISPENPVVDFFLALVFLASQDHEKAKESLEQGLLKKPDNVLGQNLRALLLFHEKKTGEAILLLKKYGLAEHPRIQSILLLEIEQAFPRLLR